MNNRPQEIIITQLWLQRIVIGLDLCPFANKPWQKARIRFQLSQATSNEQLHDDLTKEIELLQNTQFDQIETTLLICPHAMNNFFAFNDFLHQVEDFLTQSALDEEFHVASFHPDYQFADTHASDVENFTNRSPYPMLHLLRHRNISEILARYGNTDHIPQKNIDTMKSLGIKHMQKLLLSCLSQN